MILKDFNMIMPFGNHKGGFLLAVKGEIPLEVLQDWLHFQAIKLTEHGALAFPLCRDWFLKRGYTARLSAAPDLAFIARWRSRGLLLVLNVLWKSLGTRIFDPITDKENN